jgi:hypothetical protein
MHTVKVGKSSEWTAIVNRAEENRANISQVLDGKPLFSNLYGTYTVTLNELKAVLKVSAQAGQSGAANKPSVESRAQDDFQEVNRCRQPRSRLNKSQHPQLSSCLEKQC